VSEKSKSENLDPFAPIIQMSDLMMKSWADVLSQTVTSPTFAKSMGEQMQGFLEGTKLIRQQTQTAMEQSMQQMNLPSREQIVSLAERLTHVEMRVDDIEAKVDESLDLLKAIQKAVESG
jgi:polyhydroxyalkanoate synthesis regulator phasin